MANVLKNETKQQVLALGRLGWSLRRIQEATHVRRETISAYLKAAGIAVWPSGGWARQGPAKPAIQGENTPPIDLLAHHDRLADFNAILNIGTSLIHDLPWITVNSTGWIARVATAGAQSTHLLWSPGPTNPCGALAAACLGTGLVFLTILTKSRSMFFNLTSPNLGRTKLL
jgi:hypothetical protein